MAPPILCIANQKGGVGKTTTAVNLAAGLARLGKRVLLVDLDIQGSATATLGAQAADGQPTVAECLMRERPIGEVVRPTATHGLFIAPAGGTLTMVDLHLASAMAREHVLRRCLVGPAVDGEYDVIIIDTAPYLGLLTVNALAASTHVLVPVSCEYLPVLGLKLFGETLDRIRASLGARCEVLGYLLTMYDRRERITVEVEELLRRRFGEAVFEKPIRIDTRHKAAPSHRQTIFEFEAPHAKGHEDYSWLAAEVSQRLWGASATREKPQAKAKPAGGARKNGRDAKPTSSRRAAKTEPTKPELFN